LRHIVDGESNVKKLLSEMQGLKVLNCVSDPASSNSLSQTKVFKLEKMVGADYEKFFFFFFFFKKLKKQSSRKRNV
jgi:hypothetical protein